MTLIDQIDEKGLIQQFLGDNGIFQKTCCVFENMFYYVTQYFQVFIVH